jgi:predicted  nucleic acid-binding Zn-ribbon protein
MKFLFLFLAIAISAVASYFTLTQSEKFQDIQKQRLDANKTNVVVGTNIDKALIDIAEQQRILAEAKDDRANAQSSVAALKLENNSIQNQVAGLDVKIQAQEVQLNELKLVVTGVKEELSKINIDVSLGTINDSFKDLTSSIEDKQKTDEGLDDSIEKEEKRLVDKRAEIDRYNDRIQARDLRIARNEIEARVTAVNHDWGFLVIGAGINSGFMPDTRLLVKRNGRLIATVRPSSIEQTQTVADIDLKSLSTGVRIQPGDEVMLAKPSNN